MQVHGAFSALAGAERQQAEGQRCPRRKRYRSAFRTPRCRRHVLGTLLRSPDQFALGRLEARSLSGARLVGGDRFAASKSGAEHQNPFSRLTDVLGSPPSWCALSTIGKCGGQCFNLSDNRATFEGMTAGKGVSRILRASVPRRRVAAQACACARAVGRCRNSSVGFHSGQDGPPRQTSCPSAVSNAYGGIAMETPRQRARSPRTPSPSFRQIVARLRQDRPAVVRRSGRADRPDAPRAGR